LKFSSVTCTRKENKFISYSSFDISVLEDDFYLIINSGFGSFTAPYCGGLNPGEIHSSGNSVISSRPPLEQKYPRGTVWCTGSSVNTVAAPNDAVSALASSSCLTQVVPPGLKPNLEIVLTYILKRSEVLGQSSSNLMEMSASRTIT
jgi:hypothetical protein